MYTEIIFEDVVPVPPELLGEDKKQAIIEVIKNKYEGKIIDKKRYILKIEEIKEIGEGEIYEDDPNVYYTITAKAIAFEPMLHEVIRGEVIEVTNFGVFVRFGPIEGLCHISQITDEYLSYDKKSAILKVENSKKILKAGEEVKARIIGISLDKKETNKILLTMKQPGLGVISWMKLDKAKKEKQKKED